MDASIFTRDLNKAFKFALELEDGAVSINRAPGHGIAKFPFGGDKDSGLNREGIRQSINQMLNEHTIILDV